MKRFYFIFFLSLSKVTQGQQNSQSSTSISQHQFIHFVPTIFSNQFTLHREPVLRIQPGDTVSTETVDAEGVDKKGIKRQTGGNPLTGPFYIGNAKPGDILAVTLIKVSLNRSYAFTTEFFGSRTLPAKLAKQFKKMRVVRWNLNVKNGFASPDSAYQHLANYKVPLKPFIGCIGVAPANKKNEILSFFSGPFGGNLDFSAIAQSATVYLPVFHEGAFFYIGDTHALQGDGELAGNALETSMDVDFTVKLIKNQTSALAFPRVEDSTYLMAIGLGKSLDDALKLATAGLLDWLQNDYQLSMAEATQVIPTSIEYTIAEVADPEVEVVAKIKKELLKTLKE